MNLLHNGMQVMKYHNFVHRENTRHFEQVFNVGFIGGIRLMHGLLPLLMKKSGILVAISSMSGLLFLGF